jgi:predicted GH43/DUF377 family glycosyl hydrolase
MNNMLFKRYEKNPVICPGDSDYEKLYTYNPAAIVHDNKIYLIYRAEGENGISSLCLAVSEDGYNFKKHDNNPIISPSLPEEKQGCEDPKITKIGNTFYLTYTSYDGMHPERSENINTSLATSKDLFEWEKKGIIVKGMKAAAIFSEKVNGKYLMFIGGKNIRIATSEDLFKWEVEKEVFLDTRKDKFDSRYTEVGPPPFAFKDRLVLFFNTTDGPGVFHTSLAILDRNNPHKIIYRADEPLMTPSEEYELEGKTNNVIFGGGLVLFKGRYFYYYGGADKYVCLATVDKTEMERYLSSLL